jgi:hypothetical protein
MQAKVLSLNPTQHITMLHNLPLFTSFFSFPFFQEFLIMSRTFIVSSIVAASIASVTFADKKEPHADIWVTALGGSLVTGGWDHITGEVIAPSLRVFEGELGLDPLFPFSGDEPGIGSDLVGTPRRRIPCWLPTAAKMLRASLAVRSVSSCRKALTCTPSTRFSVTAAQIRPTASTSSHSPWAHRATQPVTPSGQCST